MTPITAREKQVLSLRMDGLDAPVIARELGISLSTAKVHLQHLREKLGGTGKGDMWWVLVARSYERQRIQKGGM